MKNFVLKVFIATIVLFAAGSFSAKAQSQSDELVKITAFVWNSYYTWSEHSIVIDDDITRQTVIWPTFSLRGYDRAEYEFWIPAGKYHIHPDGIDNREIKMEIRPGQEAYLDIKLEHLDMMIDVDVCDVY